MIVPFWEITYNLNIFFYIRGRLKSFANEYIDNAEEKNCLRDFVRIFHLGY